MCQPFPISLLLFLLVKLFINIINQKIRTMKNLLTIAFLFIQVFAFGQIIVDVNTNFKHSVNGVDSFDRSRMIQIHADTRETDWDGWNFPNFVDLRDTVLNYYDITMGRNTGGISWNFNQVGEDPNRTGFADTTDLFNRGQNAKNAYSNLTGLHQYESRNELVIATQQHPFYPDGKLTQSGWAPANGTAIGEFMAKYIEYFHGGIGQPEPTFVEIMNEPLYELVTIGTETPAAVFQFHSEVTDEFKQHSNLPIGGYVAAFPNFEEDDFQRWHNRMKLFMDMSGSKMDFWGMHLYDFNSFWSGGFALRRGCYTEGTFDMMDHYSELSFGVRKPHVISEYGGRSLFLERQPWSPERDWSFLRSANSMLLSFTERPDMIVSAIPFVTIKAEWGRQADGDPYPWRLMRQNKEMPGQTGEYWVFTELIKFYQLWHNVKGVRVDSESTDPDIQTNTFVDGNKLYVIMNNLYFNDTTVHLNIENNHNNTIQNVRVKHLYYDEVNETPVLDDNTLSALDSFTIGRDAAVVLEYTFANNIVIDELVDEAKYYADKHLTPIIPYASHKFNINNVSKGASGEAFIRLGFGRPHGLSLQPIVKINGYDLEVPANYMGYDQLTRDSWFGVIEVPVPFYYLKMDNEVTVQFTDAGGHISSMGLRVYNHTNSLHRSDSVHVTALTIAPATKDLAVGTSYQLTPTITPVSATNHTLVWTSSDDNIATVDDYGNVTAVALGTVTITATTVDGGLTATATINVLNSVNPVLVSSLQMIPETYTLEPGNFVQLVTTMTPIDIDDKSLTWTVSDPNVLIIDSTGMVQGALEGTVQVIATTNDGSNLSDTSTITVQTQFSTFVQCFFLPSTIESDTNFTVNVDYSTGYPSNVLVELRDANNTVIANGSSAVSPGLSTTAVTLVTSMPPTLGNDYSLHVFVENTVNDSIMAECEKDNISIIPPSNTFSVELAGIQIYPNPTQGELAIETPYLKDKLMVTVFDLNGRLVRQQTITETLSRIDLTQVPAGMYLMKIQDEEASVTKRIIVR